MMPQITVLMSVHNADTYLQKAIESILNQTFRDFEFLIVNDGSTDKSSQIIKKYSFVDDRIRLIDNKRNKGLIASLNEGLMHSRGVYIARMDADDISLVNRLEKQFLFLESHKDCVCVGCKTMMIDPEGDSLKVFPYYADNEEIVSAILRGVGGAIIHPSAMIRKEAIQEVGGYDSEFKHAEDMELFLRLSEIGHLANLPEILFLYRQNPNGIGYKNRKLQQEAYLKSLKNAYERRHLAFDLNTLRESLKEEETLPYCKWGWWALSAGHIQQARKYAFKTFMNRPFSKETWKLIYCSLRGY